MYSRLPYGTLRFFLPFVVLLPGMPLTQAADIAASVINAETGQSMARVNVCPSGTGCRTEAGEAGRFLFRGVEPGEYHIRLSTGQLYHRVQPQFPILPTAGMILEF